MTALRLSAADVAGLAEWVGVIGGGYLVVWSARWWLAWGFDRLEHRIAGHRRRAGEPDWPGKTPPPGHVSLSPKVAADAESVGGVLLEPVAGWVTPEGAAEESQPRHALTETFDAILATEGGAS